MVRAWEQPKARVFNRDPIGGREKVAADVEKIDLHLVVFEECDHGFESEFAAQAESRHGCRVRFIRGWTPT
jgi:hypothetical protein